MEWGSVEKAEVFIESIQHEAQTHSPFPVGSISELVPYPRLLSRSVYRGSFYYLNPNLISHLVIFIQKKYNHISR